MVEVLAGVGGGAAEEEEERVGLERAGAEPQGLLVVPVEGGGLAEFEVDPPQGGGVGAEERALPQERVVPEVGKEEGAVGVLCGRGGGVPWISRLGLGTPGAGRGLGKPRHGDRRA